MSDFRPRIVGGEMEYNFHFMLLSGEVDCLRDEVRFALSHSLPNDVLGFRSDGYGYQINSFLENGARYYTDINHLLEYAGPECASFDDAVLYDMAAEDYVVSHMKSDEIKDITTDVKLFKRVSDHALNEHTSGSHENYFLENLDIMSEFGTNGIALHGLASHLITRSIYTGAGSTDFEGEFHKTQKLRNLSTLADEKTTGKKPIVNLRNEPLASSGGRLHVISGDANISPWATWMKFGTTSLVLRLIETNCLPKRAEISHRDIVSVARAVGSTASVDTVFRNQVGEKVTAIDIQEILYEQSAKLGNNFQLPEEEYEVLSEWGEVIDDLKIDPDKCLDRVDWLQNHHVVEQAGAKIFTRHKRDLGYTMLYPVPGFGVRLRDAGHFRRLPKYEVLNYAKKNPPEDTRAAVRGQAVRILLENEVNANIFWNKIKVKAPRIGIADFKMPVPYNNDISNFCTWLDEVL